jgi:hypothetical protein
VDYLSWTEQIGGFASRRDLLAPRRSVWISGHMSARAQQGFSELGWVFYDTAAPQLTR